MKNKFSKRILGLITAVVTVFVPLTSLTAAAAETYAYPTVYVPGFMASDIYNNVENPDEGLAWPMSTDEILDFVKDCVPALLEFSVTRDWDKLGNAISPLALSFFGKSICDPDGGITNGSGVIFEYPSAETVRNSKYTIFNYDWRADPLETAEKLNDYINYILEACNTDKIALKCHSLGGIITLTYCTLYGCDKLDAVAFNSAAIFGESYTGDMLSGDMILSSDALFAFMDFVFDSTEQEELWDKIFDILENAGLGELVSQLGNTILKNLTDILIPEVVAPLFGGWLTIWAMVPDEMIEEAESFTFTNFMPRDSEETLELKQKIDTYNSVVRAHKKETLLEIDAKCKVGVIARYGYSSIPATSSWQEISDGVVDTKNSSFGATVSLYGTTLDDDILANTDKEYISPDLTINAQTCLFPEKTWFIKNAKHSDSYDALDTLIDKILYSDEEITVDTYEEFPRFLKYDYATDSINPDNSTPKADVSQNIFEMIVEKFKKMFAEIFNKLRAFIGII